MSKELIMRLEATNRPHFSPYRSPTFMIRHFTKPPLKGRSLCSQKIPVSNVPSGFLPTVCFSKSNVYLSSFYRLASLTSIWEFFINHATYGSVALPNRIFQIQGTNSRSKFAVYMYIYWHIEDGVVIFCCCFTCHCMQAHLHSRVPPN